MFRKGQTDVESHLLLVTPVFSECLPAIMSKNRSSSALLWFSALSQFCFRMFPVGKSDYMENVLGLVAKLYQSEGEVSNKLDKMLMVK